MFAVKIVIVVSILYLIYYIVARRYFKRLAKIEEHIQNDDIIPAIVADTPVKEPIRIYAVRYIKDGQEHLTRLNARSYLDAKYQAIVNLDIDLKSILSVV